MTSRVERIAENEAELRTANEQLNAWPEMREQARRGERQAFLCECARPSCGQELRLTADEYEAVRADARRFAIAPGHDFPEAEFIVEQRETYVVVQKREEVRAIVERTNPRRHADA